MKIASDGNAADALRASLTRLSRFCAHSTGWHRRAPSKTHERETMTTKLRRRYRRALPTAAILLLTLAGCGASPDTNSPTSTAEQTMGSEQAREEYLDLFTKVQALAPGDWTKVTPNKPGWVCDRPLGTEGTQVTFDTSRSPLSREEMDVLHDKVKALFEATGFNLRQEVDDGPNFVRHTMVLGPEKFSMGFGTGKYGITLSGNTRCFSDLAANFARNQ